MNPAALVVVLGSAARDVGLGERHAELLELDEAVSLVDVLDLIEAIEDRVASAIGRDLPEGAHRARAARILELAEAGLRDPEIATTVGASVEVVRAVRRRSGVKGHPKPRERSGWEERIRSLQKLGLDADEIAEVTGWSRRTVVDRIRHLAWAELQQGR